MQAVVRTVYHCLPPPAFPGSDLPCVGGSELPRSVQDWRSTPLHLDDGDLLRSSQERVSRIHIQRVSRILLEHPGPFAYVRLTNTCFDHHPAALTVWLDILASKAVKELVLVNRPLPVDMALPTSIMSCSHLKSLHLGFLCFPSTTTGRAFAFGELKELGLYSVTITSLDLSMILCASPILETLSIVSSCGTERIFIRSHATLRCLVIWSSVVKDICMQKSDSMERVILWNTMGGGSRMNVCIGDVPNLQVLGYLDPRVHNLVVRGTTIQVICLRSMCLMYVWQHFVLLHGLCADSVFLYLV